MTVWLASTLCASLEMASLDLETPPPGSGIATRAATNNFQLRARMSGHQQTARAGYRRSSMKR